MFGRQKKTPDHVTPFDGGSPIKGNHGGSGEPANPNDYTSDYDKNRTKLRMQSVENINRANSARIDYANGAYGKARGAKRKGK